MPTSMPKRKRRKNKDGAAAGRDRARLTRALLGKKKKAAAAKQPVYMVVEHGAEEPTHSVLEAAAGAAPRPLLHGERGMSFAAVATPYGPQIVGVGLENCTVYDPITSTEVLGPDLVNPMLSPVLIPHGSKLYALSRTPAVVPERDFAPWFFVLDLTHHDMRYNDWDLLPPPPIFPCRLNPLEYHNPPEVCVTSYALVGCHILLSVQQDKGTCAFDVGTKQWEMVDDRNLPFIGQAVPLGGHHFVACSKTRGGAAAVYYMDVFPPGTTSTGKTELSIAELPVESKGIVPGQLLCAMGMGSFSSFNVRSVDPGPETRMYKTRVVHRTYSQVEVDHAMTNSVVIVKQQRQIFKLHDPSCHLAYPSPVVAALTIGNLQM